jgi:hypothetical protein
MSHDDDLRRAAYEKAQENAEPVQYPARLEHFTRRLELVLESWKKYMKVRALPYTGDPKEGWFVEYCTHEAIFERWRVGYSIYDEGYTTVFHAEFEQEGWEDRLTALCFKGDDMDNFEVVPID